jgi:peroxiredoxin
MIAVGDRIPAGVLKELGPDGPQPVSTDSLFAGRNVVLFSCPGAFTPKSTKKQVPGYLSAADEILATDIDEILCISVNDSFVMAAWGEHLGVGDKIRMLADGQCEFHTSMGMEMDCTRFTLGFRNHRFSMIVEDGIVRTLNLEEPGGYDVSDASVIVQQLRERHTG